MRGEIQRNTILIAAFFRITLIAPQQQDSYQLNQILDVDLTLKTAKKKKNDFLKSLSK